MKTIILGLVGAVLLLSIINAPANAQATVTCAQDYTVSAGDWLSKLAEKFLGSPTAYHALATQTNLKSETDFTYATVVNPDSIEVGWKLCIPDQETADALNGANPPEGLSKSALENATYTSMVANAQVTLQDGTYEKQDDPTIPLKTIVTLTDQIAYGELNDIPSAAVITGETGGGSGYFYLLHIMQEKDGKPFEVANTLLGDRSPIIAIIVRDNLTSVDMITQGPDQPFCCGTLRVINNFKLEGSQLKLDSQNELGNLGPNGETPGAPLAVTGEVVYRERIAMPENAVVTVRVSDVSRQDVAAEVIGEQVITAPGNVPVKYSVPYDGSKIIPNNRYAVSARIEVNGQLMWISTTRIPVITHDAPTSDVQILVQRVGGAGGGTAEQPTQTPPPSPSAQTLTGVVWKWQFSKTPTEETTPDDSNKYTVEFTGDGKARIKADCNRGSATYTTDATVITISPIAMTRAYCGDTSKDTVFVSQLQKAGNYSLMDHDLWIALAEGAGQMKFSK